MNAWWRAVVGGGVAVLLTVGTAGPASAAAPRVSITGPTADQQVQANNLTVSVRAEMPSGVLTDRIRLTVEQLDSGRAPVTASVAATESVQTVDFPVALPFNGRYRAVVTAKGRDRPLDLNGEETATAERAFAVAAPPASPTDVKAAVDGEARTVNLTWKANTEPDLLFYLVQRSRSGSDFAVVGKVTEPRFGDATTAEAGGEYRYQVVAVRNGIQAGEGISSDPSALSAASTAAVPDPPAPPPPDPGTTAAPAGTASTVPATAPASSPGALVTSGKVDLSGFKNVQTQAARSAAPPPRRVTLPDPGFQGTLPFDVPEGTGDDAEAEAPEGGDLGELAADSPQFREIGADDDGDQRQRSLALFAGGLLATVLLMHVLWVKGEVKRVPLEAVVPEGPPPGPGPAPKRGRHGQGKAKRPSASPDWFVPELGVDDGVGRAAVSGEPRQKAS